jgi:polyhydroxybutyrate depolymerase
MNIFGLVSGGLLLAFAAVGGNDATAAETISLQYGGRDRSYMVHVPKSYDGSKAVPLLVALHGTNMAARHMIDHTDLVRKSEEIGFVLVAPNAVGNAFNDGLDRTPERNAVPDVGFIETVADESKKRYKIDGSKVYIAGFSNGGSMVQRIAVESQYEFAGLVSVVGHLRVKADRVQRPRPLLLIFGTADPLNPVAGGQVHHPIPDVKPAHSTTATAWAQRLSCEAQPVSSSAIKKVTAQMWQKCAPGGRLVWYEVDGLAHQWSGGSPMPFPAFVVGEYTDSPSLGDLVWQFLISAPQ